MPANNGYKTPDPLRRPPRCGPDAQRVALSIRLDRAVHDALIRSAEVNGRSMAGEAEFQLRQIFLK